MTKNDQMIGVLTVEDGPKGADIGRSKLAAEKSGDTMETKEVRPIQVGVYSGSPDMTGLGG